MLSGAWAYVDDMVRAPDRVEVMLDDDQRVAEVAEPDQSLDEPLVVALVQPDRRLVQDVQDTHQARSNLRGKPDALRLSPGKGRSRSHQR